jgi:L-glutamine-phosphate cytidylyltransferase
MKALLLNSGIGKRMGSLTKGQPKCLVPVRGNETILSLQIDALKANSIGDIIITTGPFEEQIKSYLKSLYGLDVFQFVHNPLYDSTNYIYSMLLAKDLLAGDIVIMHGDLVFDEILLRNILHSPYEDTVLVNPHVDLPEKDFKARIQSGRVTEISIHIFDEDCFFLIPMYKLSSTLCQKWWAEMEKFKEAGKLHVYAEDALNEILPHNALYPLYYSREFCSEIDDLKDLENVRKSLT